MLLQKILDKLQGVRPVRFPRVAMSVVEDVLKRNLAEQFPAAKVLTGIQYAVRPYPDLVLIHNGKVAALETKLSTTFQRNPETLSKS
jgi:hypothetical protein